MSDRFADQLEALSGDKLLKPESKPREDWLVLDWLTQDFLPTVLQLTIDLESDNMVVLNAMCNLLSTYTQEFGETFTRKAVAPKFVESMSSLQSRPKARSRVTILYTVAVVTGLDEKDVASHLRSLMLDVAMSQNGWTPDHFSTLQNAIQLLLEQFEDHKENVLQVMSELIVHEDARVRKLLIQLYSVLLTVLSTTDVTGRILPALITMANDSDINVRCDVIAIFGELTIMMQDANTVGRITAQLESFIAESPKFKTVQQLIKTYGKILPSIPPGFRDSFVLKQLVRLSKYTADEEDSKRQKELAEGMFDTFRALNGMSIGRDALRNHVVPGLKHLQKVGEVLPTEKRTIVNNMIGVMEQLTSGAAPPTATARASDPGTSQSSSANNTPARKSIDSTQRPAASGSGAAQPSSTFGGFFSGWSSRE